MPCSKRTDRATAAAAACGGVPVLLLAVLLLGLSVTVAAAPDAGRWLLVDTQALTLTVMDGERPQMTLHNIAIGRFGTGADKLRGDNLTPLGRFRVTAVRRDAGFHRFIALDYPGVERARRAHSDGVIGDSTYQAILAAHRRGKQPPQGTALGGAIGIHGLGRADPGVHEVMNWTRGCVAISDEQIDTLLSWLHVGMTVEIR